MGFSQFAQFFKVAFETLGNKQTLHLLLIEIPAREENGCGKTVSLPLSGLQGVRVPREKLQG